MSKMTKNRSEEGGAGWQRNTQRVPGRRICRLLCAVLERHGLIEAAPAPELGELIGSVRRLGGTLTVRSMG